MIQNKLGSTNLFVSKVALGTLTISPLQNNFSVKEARTFLQCAIDKGINFFDTAELYNNYNLINEAIKIDKEIIISSKSYAYDKAGAEKSLRKALKGIGRDYIDVFLLHETESYDTIKGHIDAINYYIKAKEKGYIRAIGVSTHFISGVRGFNKINELDIIHPIFNYKGLGINDGDISEMLDELKISKSMNKGIFSMKAFGGGNLISERDAALKFIIDNIDLTDSIAIGMKSESELIYNINSILGNNIPYKIINELNSINRTVIIEEHCIGCKKCQTKCNFDAIYFINEKAHINKEKCTLCSYCSTACKDFYIKVI